MNQAADSQALFPHDYESSRARFRASLSRVQERWPGARLTTRPLDPEDDITLDWIEAPAARAGGSCLIFTIGEHGIEGFVGSGMLELFIREFLPLLDPTNTQLILAHAINGWGMKHKRRVNGGNVDLNRNFVSRADGFDPAVNPDYDRVDAAFNPDRPTGSWPGMCVSFAGGTLASIIRMGADRFKTAALLGQYRRPKGIYYGGTEPQPETIALQTLFKDVLARCDHALLLDMHTGYGPRYDMSVVTSFLEPRSSEELAKAFGYSNVVKQNPSEFYAIEGDMIDWFYRTAERHPRHFAASFEFGTFGDSLLAGLRSLRASFFENRLYQHGSARKAAEARVRAEFQELFFPAEPKWREKALEDARTAFEGVLRAEGFM